MANEKINKKSKKRKLRKFGKIRHCFINVLILLVILIVMFCTGELFIHIFFPLPKNSGNLYRNDWNRDYRKSVFIPNAEVIDQDVPTKINLLGLKNKEIGLHKAKNILRILMFGDSFTYGAGLKIKETLPSQLERRLNIEKRVDVEIQVLNFGVSGMNTFQETMYALNYGLKFDPDIIMIQWLYNDIEMNGYTLQDFEYFVRNRILLKKSNQAFSELVPGEAIGSYKDNKNIRMLFWNFYEKLKKKSRLIHFVGMRMKVLLQKLGLNLKTSEKIIYSDLVSDGFKLSFNSLKFINNEINKLGIEFYTILYPPLQKTR